MEEKQISDLVRKLTHLQGKIIGLVKAGKGAIETLDEGCLFEARFETATKDFATFESLWYELGSLKADLGKEFPDKKWQTIFHSVSDEMLEGRAIKLQIERKRKSASPQVDISANATLNASYSRARLPQISLPQFSGDITKWTHFKDTFESLVHNDASLTKMEKFHYLSSAVKSEAASLLSKFPMEAKSYDQAWEKLNSTYNNPRVLADLLLRRILDCDSKSAKTEGERYKIFLTEVADNVDAFKALNLKDPYETLMSLLTLRALDSDTRKQFEVSLSSPSDFPTADEVIQFVRQRKTALQLINGASMTSSTTNMRASNKPVSSQSSRYPRRHSTKYKSVNLLSSSKTSSRSPSPRNGETCPCCQDKHLLYICERFRTLPPEKRNELVRGWKVCFNCLQKGHGSRKCKSNYNCRLCRKRHNTLIHCDPKPKTGPEENKSSPQPESPTQTDKEEHTTAFMGFGSDHTGSTKRSTVLLGTMRVLIKGSRGDYHSARAILDSGSQHSCITSSLAGKLGCKIQAFKGVVTSLAESTVPDSHLKGTTTCYLRPFEGEQSFIIHPLVVDKITSALPSRNLHDSVIQSLSSHKLADHQFGLSRSVDILIGGDLFPQLISGIPVKSGVDDLMLLPTPFGLVVTGVLRECNKDSSHVFLATTQDNLEDQMKAFWEIEEPSSVNRSSPDDCYCEEHFVETHSRTAEGRYVVRLPLISEHTQATDNREIVSRRFLSLENRFRKSTEFRQEYISFMEEYKTLGHMSPSSSQSSYLIPHHGIWQDNSKGRKLRVVFDASCPSKTCSLNDMLLAGPKLQHDLSVILINFRLYFIPICADLVKMYRQILVHPDDRKYQHIVWRSDPSVTLEEFELNTVTYGIKSSAFLAIRVVKQLIQDEGHAYPLAAKRLSTDIYVDDIVTGANSIEEAIQLQEELCAIFAKGGFALSKWASTLSSLTSTSKNSVESVSLLPQGENFIRILGLSWNSTTDSFSYVVRKPYDEGTTKRSMLSSIARIFDPLGLIAPVIFVAKSLIQEVWQASIGWDETLPPSLQERWKELTFSWESLSTITIPRCISITEPTFQLVGFCDASNKGYAATIYLRVEGACGTTKVALIKAKTRVAPLKYLSISRLELCGALLLSRLVSSVPEQLSQNPICFTDSTVALAWLKTPVHALRVFEANRVSQITSVIPSHRWRHVPSEDNPSDLASRGCFPQELEENRLWWNGPDWLKEPIGQWFKPTSESVVLVSTTPKKKTPIVDWTVRFSSFRLLIRTVARILRFLKRSSHISKSGPISAEEYKEAELRVVYFIQRSQLPSELFSSSTDVPKPFLALSPFIDERGIVRVGGRLRNAPLEYDAKHPILLPTNSHYARLVIQDIHSRHFHAGSSLTLSLLRSKYWVPRAAKLIKSCITRCIHCRLQRVKPSAPLMSALPIERFLQVRAFAQVGLDYAGPFSIKESPRRNASLGKAYLCLFVCFSSKALHLELVSSLSTPAFLAVLDRFISRRGSPSTIWSDHGTNFVGASRFLKDIYKFQCQAEPEIVDTLSPRGIEWRFIPPRAPHFGGLWEAGIKSAKRLLTQSIGKSPYTFEELATAFTKVEALLNSRPLCALSEDAHNFDFLTPGHFLVGGPICSPPEPSTLQFRSGSHTSRWQAMQSQIARTWERWRREYLHSLQQRSKWTRPTPGLKVGDLAILVEKRSMLGQWPVARVVKVFPGRDGVVRAVEVRTPKDRYLTRAVTSLAPLFPPSDAEDHPNSEDNC